MKTDGGRLASKRRRVAVIHLVRDWVGGGEAVALASIDALKDEYDVSLIGVTRPDLQRMNSLFGTKVSWSDVRWRPVPRAPLLRRLLPGRFEFLHQVLLPMHFCRSLAREYDVMLSTYNDMDLGKPGIQYCHHPGMAMAFKPEIVKRVSDLNARVPSAAQCLVNRAVVSMTGYRERRVRRNVTLANSAWTARIMEEAYGGPVQVVYPPVGDIPDQLPWAERENGFLCIGRFVRSKRIHDIIAILDGVRARGFDIHLHVVSSYIDRDYFAEMEPTLRARASWVHLEWSLGQDALFRLLSSHKFGIHAMENEHFGIAVAEMVKAGMIVFVPDSGGQVEIVADPRLTYAAHEDAVAKIAALLRDPPAQQNLLEHLGRQGEKFSRARFAAEVRASVARLEAAAPA